ncbi:TRAP transporter small permease [Desulfocicer vacuolatum]|nr:TRAP transporter small permease [Desulfocicer vacuolatum]
MKKVSGVMLVAMMLVTCLDVGGNIFGHPLLGSEEIVSLLAALLIAFTLPAAHQERAHIGVDMLYLRFSPRTKKINDSILCVITAIFFSLVSWECFKYAGDLKRIGQVTAVLELPIYYILYAVSAGCGFLSLVVVSQLLKIIREGSHE